MPPMQQPEGGHRGSDPPRREGRRSALVIAAGLILAIALGLWHSTPPRPVGPDAPATEFSAGRAMAMLAGLSAEPHPTGSEAGRRAADWVAARMREVGLDVEVQETVGLAEWGPVAARVRNVIGLLPGTDSTGTVLLVAHHDSVPSSPGAGDDGAGVVALLEAARALRTGSPLRNDVALLITDAEEVGLLGAEAFAAEHPLMGDVRVVLNFEGRGRGGVVTMFETGPESGRLIRTLAAVAPHPIADSLSYEIYRRMPNDTDLSVFKRAGIAGLNFAFIGGFAHYHAAVDDLAALDPGSVQHHGSYALSMARALGATDLSSDLRAPDRVYFPLPALGLVHYPASWAWPMALISAFLLLALLVNAVRAGRARPVGLAIGTLAMVGAGAAGGGLAWGGTRLLIAWNPQSAWMVPAHPYNAGSAILAVMLLALFGVALVYAPLRRRPLLELWLPVLLVWAVLLLLVAYQAPGASYLFQWPLLAALLAVEVRQREGDGRVAEGAGLALALPAVLLLAPLPPFVIEALGLPMAPVGAAVVVLLALLLVPQLAAMLRPLALLLPGALAVAALAAAAMHLAGSGWSERHPRPNTLLYALDADAREAWWLSYDPEPDEWTRGVLGDAPERSRPEGFGLRRGRAPMIAPAPALGEEGPRVEVLDEQPAGEGARRLTLRITGRPGTAILSVYATGADAITGLEVEGRPTAPLADLLMRFSAPGAEGVVLAFDAPTTPVQLSLVETRFGLPPLGGLSPRPAGIIPRRSTQTDLTLIRGGAEVGGEARPDTDRTSAVDEVR